MGAMSAAQIARTVVLFPAEDAQTLREADPRSFDTVVVLDSKWKKASGLVCMQPFQAMRKVCLRDVRSCFWRYHTQGVAQEGLSTVEAVYFMLKEYDAAAAAASSPSSPEADADAGRKRKRGEEAGEGTHRWDDMLYYFSYMHSRVQRRHQPAQRAAPAD
mmetsp:Transcript_2325/g.8317  ORF Transcript_2325/g.8317 Transcript_2325/m.8317 type:complete len:160 (+) Transcript_2325:406-885(+)